MKHTPGPWRIEDIESTQPYTEYDVYADDHRVMHVHDIDDGAEANALLIAAAPDLYEACKRALVYIQSDPAVYPLISAIKNAIAKAEGGTK